METWKMFKLLSYTIAVATCQHYMTLNPDFLPGTRTVIGISYEFMSFAQILLFNFCLVVMVVGIYNYLKKDKK